jgi:hypothetical protein
MVEGEEARGGVDASRFVGLLTPRWLMNQNPKRSPKPDHACVNIVNYSLNSLSHEYQADLFIDIRADLIDLFV